MLISDPFYLKTMKNFNSSPPFGLYDIFWLFDLPLHRLRQAGLAANKSYEDYRLFDDGYVESLITAQLNQEGVHVYAAKCGLS